MCYITSRKQEPKIAEEDIEVYKTMGCIKYLGLAFTPYHFGHFTYFLNKCTKEVKLDPFLNQDKWKIYQGYHSYDRHGMGRYFNDRIYSGAQKIYKFIIPKGAEYYHNTENGELVSNKLIYKGKRKIPLVEINELISIAKERMARSASSGI